MVASQDIDFFRVLDFVGVKETNGLDALSSSIDVIAQKEIIWIGRETAILEETEHVVVLAMDIAADFERGLDFDEHGLAEEDVFDSPDDSQNDWLLQLDQLSRLVVPDFEQGFDGCVDVDVDFLTHF